MVGDCVGRDVSSVEADEEIAGGGGVMGRRDGEGTDKKDD